MKRILISFLFVIAAIAAEPADKVREAAEGWTEAAVKQDKAGLERFLAADLQYAHAGGQTQDKQQYITAVTSGAPRYESFSFSGLTIRIYGRSAVLTGFVDVKMAGQTVFRVRTLQVYTENHHAWQMAAHQSTRITTR